MNVIHVMNDYIIGLLFVVLDVTGLENMIGMTWLPGVALKC